MDAAGYPKDSVGELMGPPVGVVPEALRLPAAIEELKRLSGQNFITYLYAVDAEGRLTGVIVLKDLFLNPPEKTLADIAIKAPFYLTPEMPLIDAMRAVVCRHFPVYPVCDAERRIIGLVRGQALFERQAINISAQAGSMVGVRKQERLATDWWQSLLFRQPWLQLNLLLSLMAAVVIGYFQHAIGKLVLLAVFFPVVSSQARNTGAQTMAITLRGLSTGEWQDGKMWRVLTKEVALGAVNGALVGLVSGAVIAFAARDSAVSPWLMAFVMLAAMAGGCALSGLFGVLIPLSLRVVGADPALAASILLTTIATVLSQGLFLQLAAWLVVRK